MNRYNVKFSTQSKNAGGSMPLGGRDIGCNVWVEDGSLYVYMAQSGAFDELGNMVKAGRLKVDLSPNPFGDSFSQELRLESGDIEIVGIADDVTTTITLWVDITYGALHLDIDSEVEHDITVAYQNWRSNLNGYRYPDLVMGCDDSIEFCHPNRGEDHFNFHVAQEGLESIADRLPNVQKGIVFGGCVIADGMTFVGRTEDSYADLACDSYTLKSRALRQAVRVYLHIARPSTVDDWRQGLQNIVEAERNDHDSHDSTIRWWKRLWQRSYINISPGGRYNATDDADWQVGRNYQLFRYMLACNAYGEYPTKFNGGLFTIDPCFWGARFGAKTPDERDWGGIVFTAQNQRHMYWPMLKSGDFDMVAPQFEFYFRLLDGAIARTSHFFSLQNAAAIPEQTDANGMSAYYGLYGLDYPIHVRYHYVTSVEFGYMMLKYIEAADVTETDSYINFIDVILNLYDQMYSKRDADGKRVIFPSTAQETYHKAGIIEVWGEEGRYAANYDPEQTAATNPADLIYALRAITKELLDKGFGTTEQRDKWSRLRSELPPIPLEVKNGHTVIAPCELPKEYVKTNCEFPQLYPAFPYHEIGIGDSNNHDLQLAIDTYHHAWDEKDQLMNISWMHVGNFAARLGLVDEAHRYVVDKLKDSGRRFPAFWGPGHDYTPDHNWGGSGMTLLQEMLLQNFDGKIYLLPAWPKHLDVEFKLWVEKNTYIEVSYAGGKLEYNLSDKSRNDDVVIC